MNSISYMFLCKMGVMKPKPFAPQKFRKRIFSQLWMLALQFVLGMMLNLLNGNLAGYKHTVYVIVLILHILNAIGLVEGGFFVALKEWSKLSWWAAATLSLTFCAGVLFVITKQDTWSFIMACGFLLSTWLNGLLYIRADRQLHINN